MILGFVFYYYVTSRKITEKSGQVGTGSDGVRGEMLFYFIIKGLKSVVTGWIFSAGLWRGDGVVRIC